MADNIEIFVYNALILVRGGNGSFFTIKKKIIKIVAYFTSINATILEIVFNNIVQ